MQDNGASLTLFCKKLEGYWTTETQKNTGMEIDDKHIMKRFSVFFSTVLYNMSTKQQTWLLLILTETLIYEDAIYQIKVMSPLTGAAKLKCSKS